MCGIGRGKIDGVDLARREFFDRPEHEEDVHFLPHGGGGEPNGGRLMELIVRAAVQENNEFRLFHERGGPD